MIACDTDVSLSPSACNTCMRRYCCDSLENCTNTECLDVESCAEQYGCFESSNFETCLQRYCGRYAEQAEVYLGVLECFTDRCSEFCE